MPLAGDYQLLVPTLGKKKVIPNNPGQQAAQIITFLSQVSTPSTIPKPLVALAPSPTSRCGLGQRKLFQVHLLILRGPEVREGAPETQSLLNPINAKLEEGWLAGFGSPIHGEVG